MRIIIKTFSYLFLVAMGLLLVGLVLIKTEFAEKAMTEWVSTILSDKTGMPVTIGIVNFAFPNKLQASHVIVGDAPDPKLIIQKTELTILYPAFTIDLMDCQIEALKNETLHLTVNVSVPFQTWKQLITDQKLENMNGTFSIDGRDLKAQGFFAIADNPLLHVSQLRGTKGLFNFQGDLFLSSTLALNGSNLQISVKDFSDQLFQNQVQGGATATIFLEGAVHAPKINFQMSGDQVSVNHLHFERVFAKADILYHHPQWNVNAHLFSFIQNHPIELNSLFSLNGTLLLMKQIQIIGPETELKGALSIDLDHKEIEGKLEGQCQNLAFLQPLIDCELNGEGKFSAAFLKTPAQMVDLEIETPYLMIDDIRVEGAKLQSRMTHLFDRPSGNLHIALARASWDQGRLENLIAESEIDLAQDSWPFSCAFNGKWRKSYHLSAKGKWCAGKNFLRLALDSCDGKAAKIPFSLQKAFSANLESGTAELTPLSLNIGNGRLQGSLSYSKTYSQLLLEAVQIPAPLIQFMFPHLPILGSLSGHATLSGPPHFLEGDLALTFNDLSINEAALAKIFPIQGSIQANLRDRNLQCVGNISGQGQPLIRLSSRIPFHFSLAPFAIEIDRLAPITSHCSASFEIAYLLQLLALDTTRVAGQT